MVHGEIEPPEQQSKIKAWAKKFGMFATDPTFDDFLDEIAHYRHKVIR
jgi:hypothetical protein